MRAILSIVALVSLSSCYADETELKVEVLPKEPGLDEIRRFRLYSSNEAVCLRSDFISIIRSQYDPQESIYDYGSPYSEFYFGFAEYEPVFIIDKKGLTFAVTIMNKQPIESEIEYVACKDLIERRVRSVKSVSFSLN